MTGEKDTIDHAPATPAPDSLPTPSQPASRRERFQIDNEPDASVEAVADESQTDEGAEDDGDGPVDLLGGDDDEDGEGDGVQPEAKPDASLSVVPKTADGYAIPEIEGLELSETDKTALGGFMKHAHAVGAPQSAVNAVLSFYKELKAAQMQLDADTVKSAKTELVGELGQDFKLEAGRLNNALRGMPEGLGADIRNARFLDGRKLINDPRFFRWMQGQNAMTRVPTPTDRKAEIEKIMKEDINRYYDEGLDAEYAKLLARLEGVG